MIHTIIYNMLYIKVYIGYSRVAIHTKCQIKLNLNEIMFQVQGKLSTACEN